MKVLELNQVDESVESIIKQMRLARHKVIWFNTVLSENKTCFT